MKTAHNHKEQIRYTMKNNRAATISQLFTKKKKEKKKLIIFRLSRVSRCLQFVCSNVRICCFSLLFMSYDIIIYDSKCRVFEFWIVGWTKEAISLGSGKL